MFPNFEEKIVHLSRPTVNKIFNGIRERIAKYCEEESLFKNGYIELDESYFGARRVRGIWGRGARGKIPVFGMLKRGDKAYTQIVKNCSMSELIPIIKGKADKNAVIYTDGFKTYDRLTDYGYKKHYRMKRSDSEFATEHYHINGIANYWGLSRIIQSAFG